MVTGAPDGGRRAATTSAARPASPTAPHAAPSSATESRTEPHTAPPAANESRAEPHTAPPTEPPVSAQRFETIAVHCGEEPNMLPGGSGDVVMPIHLSTTFARREIEEPTAGYEYARSSNPTRRAVEMRLAALEGAEYGFAFSSGVAAQTAIVLACARSGDHIIAFDDIYGGSRRLFSTIFAPQYNISVDYVDARSVERVEQAITARTRLIWLESPTNPLLKICDIQAIADVARRHRADRDILVAVDNTFASPYFQNPLMHGAHIVHHSATKYIGGHSDCIGGAVMVRDAALADSVRHVQNSSGAILSPFDSYLLLRGIKTLPLRMERCSDNAIQIARFLQGDGRVRNIVYPTLDSHPQRELAARQMRGGSGMLIFELPGALPDAKKFLRSLRTIALAESLGAVETLVEHPAIMTHASVPQSERQKIGISDSLIRMSVGIEHIDDLIADIQQALDAI